jgi:transcriptional regulator with XRE-family HTH domain
MNVKPLGKAAVRRGELYRTATKFGFTLRALREKRPWTLRELESASGVPNSHISAMESGKRRCGAVAARKLADALFGWQDSKEKNEFMYAAAATIKARGAIKDAELYHPAILDAVCYKLRQMGICDKDIQHASLGVERVDGVRADLFIMTKTNDMFDVNISIVKREM